MPALPFPQGLGTWDGAAAKDLLAAASPVRVVGDDEADASMELAFDAKKADARKDWILANVATPPVPDYSAAQMTATDFVNKDLVNYSIYSVQRALPGVMDGLKTGQRKVIFTVLQRNYLGRDREVKVAQLAGAVAELTLYLHGEASLNATIVNLAQDFVGTNNVPLLFPDGAFGTRLSNGGDAASPRYIYTYGTAALRLLFRPEDDVLLPRLKEEGHDVEPAAYWPTLPLLLINGSDAIATGYSTKVPSYNPRDVFDNVKRLLSEELLEPMTPWFRGFKGEVVEAGDGKWRFHGIVEQDDDEPSQWVVTELPPGTSYNAFAEFLESEKSPARLVENRCTDTDAHIVVKFAIEPKDAEEALEKLKLSEALSGRNMHAFNLEGNIRKYASSEDVLTDWVPWRLTKYELRRVHLVQTLGERANELESKARFIRAVVSKKLDITTYQEAGLLELLKSKDFVAPEKLMDIPAKSFTLDRAEDAERQAATARAKAQRMQESTAKDLWLADLEALEAVL
jgi:DNA topoisomerase-2